MKILDRLEELEKEVTPGPWVTSVFDEVLIIIGDGINLPDDILCALGKNGKNNRAFIAESRNALPALLKVVRAAKAMRDAFSTDTLPGRGLDRFRNMGEQLQYFLEALADLEALDK